MALSIPYPRENWLSSPFRIPSPSGTHRCTFLASSRDPGEGRKFFMFPPAVTRPFSSVPNEVGFPGVQFRAVPSLVPAVPIPHAGPQPFNRSHSLGTVIKVWGPLSGSKIPGSNTRLCDWRKKRKTTQPLSALVSPDWGWL